MSFQSATEIENKRQQLREARQTYLAKVFIDILLTW